MKDRKELFNSPQRVGAKLLYHLMSQLSEEQRKGAVLALTMLLPLVEEGYIAMNQENVQQDFYAQCFDALTAVAISLKMMEDDGMIPQDLPNIEKGKIIATMAEADFGVERTELQLLTMAKPNETLQ